MYSSLTVVSLVLSLILLCDSERILVVVPTPSISHQVVFRPLTQELARRGHEVVVLTADPAFPKGQNPANLTEIDVHDISYERWINGIKQHAEGNGLNNNHYKLIKSMLKLLPSIFEIEMNNTEFRKVISEDRKFDLVILEACMRPTLVLPYILKTPAIAMSSFGAMMGHYNTFGVPSHPMLYPIPIRQRLYNLTLWEKVTELYNHFYLEYIFDHNEHIENEVVRRVFGSDIPPLIMVIAEYNNRLTSHNVVMCLFQIGSYLRLFKAGVNRHFTGQTLNINGHVTA
ncbi:uncharacterized protein LOC113227371 [Hyposmocoma kahamanoa]|uniref:uncharacterized protein LOC113227371 n=1 Tax=Hyposmocoma kahamanoa TaxID=1477025 RepID=UPI000E6D80F6|nr:uncharacterized protein LOC113227371 [Hyposmocoma kahamanoa]